MSYSDFLKSTQGQLEKTVTNSSSVSIPSTPTPAPTIPRKPPANYSPIPFSSVPGSVHKTVTQFNNLRSVSTSNLGSSTSPVSSIPKRSFSPAITSSPVTVTRIAVESPPLNGSPYTAPSSTLTPAPPPAVTAAPTSAPAPIAAPVPVRAVNAINDYPPPPAHAEWHAALKQCLAIQNDAVAHHSKRPFAALLLGPDKTTTLLSHMSISHVQHAESELARLASIQYSIDYLRKCTLVSTWEPCAMCAGTIYWSGIGRCVYAASEAKLRDLTGPSNSENMTMNLPCRTVFSAGQTKVEVVGPVPGWEDKVVEESRKWWRGHHNSVSSGRGPAPAVSLPSGSLKAPSSATASVKSESLRSIVITNPPPEEGVLSRIGEDGEYRADLKVDWMM